MTAIKFAFLVILDHVVVAAHLEEFADLCPLTGNHRTILRQKALDRGNQLALVLEWALARFCSGYCHS